MIRPVLAIMAGLLCGMLGMRHGRAIREQSASLRRWETLLRHLCLILREGALPLPEAFLQAATEPTAADNTLRSLALRMQEEPLTDLPQLYTPTGPEGPVLQRMFTGLATGSLEERLLAAAQAADEIALLAQSTGDKAATDARMWLKLGWLCGACVTLMLL